MSLHLRLVGVHLVGAFNFWKTVYHIQYRAHVSCVPSMAFSVKKSSGVSSYNATPLNKHRDMEHFEVIFQIGVGFLGSYWWVYALQHWYVLIPFTNKPINTIFLEHKNPTHLNNATYALVVASFTLTRWPVDPWVPGQVSCRKPCNFQRKWKVRRSLWTLWLSMHIWVLNQKIWVVFPPKSSHLFIGFSMK